MIQLVIGEKGTGKTKMLIDQINKVAQTSPGHVICIEKTMNLQYALTSTVRLIYTDDYKITGYQAFYGFLCGILAGNYDIKDVFIDEILSIGGDDLDEFSDLLQQLKKRMQNDISVTFSVSTSEQYLPESLKQYLP